MSIRKLNKEGFLLKDSQIFFGECFIIICFSALPLFKNFPFTGNIYLSWEGAYRLYLGQIPFKDFDLPMGFGFWIIPALFFKIFGPYLFTLIKAQVFINIISAFAFRSILKSFRISPPVRFLGVLLYIISFSYIKEWPWYNHTVIVYEFISLAILLKYIFRNSNRFGLVFLFFSCFFLFLSFFTKQDAGAFAFLISLALMICHGIYEKSIVSILWFLVFYLIIAVFFIFPFIPYGIGYWFNYGQAPHNSRLSLYEIINVFLVGSAWIKFYILVIVLILISRLKSIKSFLSDKYSILFTVLVIGILFEASVTQVTSYVPKNTNIFFHSFAIVYIFNFSGLYKKINFRRPLITAVIALLVLLWWSAYPWDYANAIIVRHFPEIAYVDTNQVSIRTFIQETKEDSKNSKWILAPWPQFRHIYMPEETIDGIERVMSLDIVKIKNDSIKFLNMSELTPLEDMMGCIPETGKDIPLWYQKNVGMFQKQIDRYKDKIRKGYYDLILYEYVPSDNNFYPFEIRSILKKYYHQIDGFNAPRRAPYGGEIEVFIKKVAK